MSYSGSLVSLGFPPKVLSVRMVRNFRSTLPAARE
jgi:hypothetical protein